MKKFVKITQPNKIIYFKNRKVRTPVILEVIDSDLKNLEVIFKMVDIQDFEVLIKKPKIKSRPEVEMFNFDENEETVIEEFELEKQEPITILEKLVRNGEEE